jgi:hypothetical protein
MDELKKNFLGKTLLFGLCVWGIYDKEGVWGEPYGYFGLGLLFVLTYFGEFIRLWLKK